MAHRLLPDQKTPPAGYKAVRCSCGNWNVFVSKQDPNHAEREHTKHIASITNTVQKGKKFDHVVHKSRLMAQAQKLGHLRRK